MMRYLFTYNFQGRLYGLSFKSNNLSFVNEWQNFQVRGLARHVANNRLYANLDQGRLVVADVDKTFYAENNQAIQVLCV